ncbi:MAG: VOC family protein, partial [Dehalococcoidia bacterium]
LVPLGEPRLEFLQPTHANSEVSRFLERRGEGLHHVAFQVEDIQGKLKLLKARGIELVEPEPRPGLTGMVAFIHPRAAQGVLVELVQRF